MELDLICPTAFQYFLNSSLAHFSFFLPWLSSRQQRQGTCWVIILSAFPHLTLKKIIIYDERKERFSVSDNSSASCYHGTPLTWGCWCKCTWAAWWHAGQAWWQWIIWGQGLGHSESPWQSRNWVQAKAVWAFVQLSGSVLGLLGCHGIPGLSFKSTSTDLWAGWRPIKPAAILHGGSLWSSAKLWNSSWALSWFFWHSDKCKPKASTQILPNYGECAKMDIIFKYLPLFCGLWDGHRDTKQ